MRTALSTKAARSPLGLRVLQLGPLYNNHLRRWSQLGTALGCEVWAAGHEREGRRSADLRGLARGVEAVPPEADREKWLAGLLARLSPDVVHAHFLHGWAHTAVRVSDAPVVVTPWGSDLYLARGRERRRADRALAGADRVLARSPHMERELLARGVPAAKLVSVDLGVDLDRFRPGRDVPAQPRILSLRAGTRLYNLDVAIQAAARVREELSDAVLDLVHGDAPLDSHVEALMPADGVRVLGRVEHAEMPEHMRAAAVGISIPTSDGSPSSVWEALASGLPLVLSDLPQVRERVGGCPAVRLVPPEAEAVAESLLDLLGADRAALSRAARDWAVANADEREQRSRLGAVYAAMSGSSAV